MKLLFTRCLFVVMASFFLAGCEDKKTYSYLVQHPIELKKAFDVCQASNEKSSTENAQCEVVMSAATYVSNIMSEAQSDPEKFGERILAAQVALANKREELDAARVEWQQLTADKAGDEKIKAADAKYQQVKKDYKSQHDEVKALLAVLGINTPE